MKFTLSEFIKSKTAEKAGIDNTPDFQHVANLRELVVAILEPARHILGAPININSGYRCPQLNKLVSGSATSQHMVGEAADITCHNNRRLFEIIKTMEFDQLIWENGGEWIHVSFSKNKNRKQVLCK